jgi:magnesium chelatase subunit D
MSAPRPDLPGGLGALAALLLAVDARGLGGAVLDHPVHEQARLFASLVRSWLPAGAPLRRVPSSVTADRLYGGVDLASTLATGKIVAERGVLAGADGGVLVIPMAERLNTSARTAVCEVLDHGEITVQREGIADRHDARVCALLLDESVDDELVHPALKDRLAFSVRFDGRTSEELEWMADETEAHHFETLVREARVRLSQVSVDDEWAAALCQTADAFGVDSVRATLFALRCARAGSPRRSADGDGEGRGEGSRAGVGAARHALAASAAARGGGREGGRAAAERAAGAERTGTAASAAADGAAPRAPRTARAEGQRRRQHAAHS